MFGKVLIVVTFLALLCAYPAVLNIREGAKDKYENIITGLSRILVDDVEDSKEVKNVKDALRQAYSAILAYRSSKTDGITAEQKEEAMLDAIAALSEVYQESIAGLIYLKSSSLNKCDIFSNKDCETQAALLNALMVSSAEVIVGFGRLVLSLGTNSSTQPLAPEEL